MFFGASLPCITQKSPDLRSGLIALLVYVGLVCVSLLFKGLWAVQALALVAGGLLLHSCVKCGCIFIENRCLKSWDRAEVRLKRVRFEHLNRMNRRW